MKLILSIVFFLLILIQIADASDYIYNSDETFDIPIDLTILETRGTITDTNNNTIGNFTHYLIGFEIFLENYSLEIDDTSPQLENYTYDPFGQRIKIMRNDTASTTIYTPFKDLMRIVSGGFYEN